MKKVFYIMLPLLLLAGAARAQSAWPSDREEIRLHMQNELTLIMEEYGQDYSSYRVVVPFLSGSMTEKAGKALLKEFKQIAACHLSHGGYAYELKSKKTEYVHAIHMLHDDQVVFYLFTTAHKFGDTTPPPYFDECITID